MANFIPAIFSGIQAGSQLAAGSQENALSEYNAKIDELDASKVLQDAQEQAFVELQLGRMIAGEQAVGFAAGGVVSTTGTPAVLKAAEAAMAAQRVSSVLFQGQSQANALRRQAEVSRFEGKTAKRTSRINALTTLGKGVYSTSKLLKNKPKNTALGSRTTNYGDGSSITLGPLK